MLISGDKSNRSGLRGLELVNFKVEFSLRWETANLESTCPPARLNDVIGQVPKSNRRFYKKLPFQVLTTNNQSSAYPGGYKEGDLK
ncbi:hypothetical protein [Zeaxanthinibacter enoshimensis]|uniref:hypothetical protein n=1 Tax=Zeaxanthinibacter enoshimensis TaxID=392009 RepID=UPI0035693857